VTDEGSVGLPGEARGGRRRRRRRRRGGTGRRRERAKYTMRDSQRIKRASR